MEPTSFIINNDLVITLNKITYNLFSTNQTTFMKLRTRDIDHPDNLENGAHLNILLRAQASG